MLQVIDVKQNWYLKKETKTINDKRRLSFGIIDKDFDSREELIIKDILECTDKNDLETTLLSLDLNNISSKFAIDSGNESIIALSINNACEIGKLRKILPLLRKQIKRFSTVSFKELESFSNGFYKYIKGNNHFDIKDVINDMNISVENISLLNAELKKYPENTINLCRGHDIFDFVTGYYAKEQIIKNPNGKYLYERILSNRSKYEKQMESFFKEEKFLQSNLYQFLLMIDKTVI